MNTHKNALTHTEEELSEEQILTDIQRRIQAATLPQEFDARALAVRAVKQYWADRERGVIDRQGRPLDDIIIANRAAIRRIREYEGGGQLTNFLAVALPPLVAIVVLVLSPSILNAGAWLFRQDSAVKISALLLLLGIVGLGALDSRLKEKWLDEGKLYQHHMVGLLVGGLFAATVTLAIGQQTEQGKRRAAEAQAARQRAEEELRNVEEEFRTFSSKAARQEIIALSRDKLQEQIKTGSFNESSSPAETTLPVTQIKMTRKNISKNNVVYVAEGEPLPEPVEIMLNKESGHLKTEGSSEEKLRFYAAVVKDTSGNALTLSVKDEDGKETSLTWAPNDLKFHPKPGQRVFVVVDAKTNKATEVTEFEPDSKKDETPRPR